MLEATTCTVCNVLSLLINNVMACHAYSHPYGNTMQPTVLFNHFCIGSMSHRRPWSFFLAQLVVTDPITLIVEMMCVMDVGDRICQHLDERRFLRVYVATGTLYAVTSWVVGCLHRASGHGGLIGPVGSILGLVAALVGTEMQTWRPPAQFYLYTIGPLETVHLLGVFMCLNVITSGVSVLPSTVLAAMGGYYLGAFYAAQWHLGIVAAIDKRLDALYEWW